MMKPDEANLIKMKALYSSLMQTELSLADEAEAFAAALGEARATKQTGDAATAHDAYGKLVALSNPIGPAAPNWPRPSPT
jgi:hypothetical protein